MSAKNKTISAKNINSDAFKVNFITDPQYVALEQHFRKIIENMKNKDELKKIRVEFSKLLNMFRTSYRESEKKTKKIRELTAVNAIEIQRVQSVESSHDVIITDLKNTIDVLQRDLDTAMEQRTELFEEISKLKQSIETEDKMIQADCKIIEKLPYGEVRNLEDVSKYSMKENISFAKKSMEKELKNAHNKEITDSTILRNNLEILVADLKSARNKIAELKRVIHKKDILAEEYVKDLSDSELKLKEEQKRAFKIQRPMKMSLEFCRKELEDKKEKLQKIENEFEKIASLNSKIEKENLLKDSIVKSLTDKMKDLESETESAVRRAETFEGHLAESQNRIEESKREVEYLQQKIRSLKEAATVIVSHAAGGEKEKHIEFSIHEKMIDSYKNQIIVRDKKLLAIGRELKTTVEILQSVKHEQIAMRKENSSLESEIKGLKKILKERNIEIKQLKDKLRVEKEEIMELKAQIRSRIMKHQQILEKKNKFHSLYTHMKSLNNQQKNESVLLSKRQEYLVKILREKDSEIEKLVKWKRYIC